MLQARTVEPIRDRPGSWSALSRPLARLVTEIGAACDGPAEEMGPRVRQALQEAAVTPGLLAPELRVPCADSYARHPIWADPDGRFTLLSLVWAGGQFSPPHAHKTWCAYSVVDNVLTETLYEFDHDLGKAAPLRAESRAPGYACFAKAGLDQIHRLGNGGGVPAISIHVYGVEGRQVCTHVNRLIDVTPARERYE